MHSHNNSTKPSSALLRSYSTPPLGHGIQMSISRADNLLKGGNCGGGTVKVTVIHFSFLVAAAGIGGRGRSWHDPGSRGGGCGNEKLKRFRSFRLEGGEKTLAPAESGQGLAKMTTVSTAVSLVALMEQFRDSLDDGKGSEIVPSNSDARLACPIMAFLDL
ncbi:hypothetical protein BT69DRAFT_1300156 [Atractiella rhizophila]|nr:hypothetical protein BT69DRAFT_1300156 [Atractiella rhizophila]